MHSLATYRYVLSHITLLLHAGVLLLLAASSIACSHDSTQPDRRPPPGSGQADTELPPDPGHEFRGIFVTTAYNLDWPTRPGLHPCVLSDEIRAIVGRAKELNCNVIILQVRAFADRMHRNTRLRKPEPWSAALNPGDDRDPDKKQTPDYDPLGDWITQCHAAGIELHAWINPFRIDRTASDAKGKPFALLASDNFDTLFLDYTQTNVQDYVIDVIDDLLRYRTQQTATVTTPGGGALKAIRRGRGIDGILFDHNLPSDHPHGTSQPATLYSASPRLSQHQRRVRWLATQHAAPAGPKTLDDFVERVFQKVYRDNGLKFGISPLREDTHSRDWLKNGRVNYIVPELYFKGRTGDVRKELKTWLDNVRPQSGFTPIVVGGLFTMRTQTPEAGSDEPWSGTVIAEQIVETRPIPGRRDAAASGQAHYSWSALREPACGGPIDSKDPQNTLGALLKNTLYRQPALVPNCTAVAHATRPAGPTVVLKDGTAQWQLPRDSKTQVHFWAVWLHDSASRSRGWGSMLVLDAAVTDLNVRNTVDRIAVKAVDRHNRESAYGLSSR